VPHRDLGRSYRFVVAVVRPLLVLLTRRRWCGAQHLPAQGGFVEFTFAEDGLYPFVTHKFANVGKGAIGFFAVGDVDTTALTGH